MNDPIRDAITALDAEEEQLRIDNYEPLSLEEKIELVKRELAEAVPECWPTGCGDDPGFFKATGYNECRKQMLGGE